MKKAVAITPWALCFLFVFLGSGYGASVPSNLVGQWVLGTRVIAGKPESMELFKDGTGTVDSLTDISWKVKNKNIVISLPSRYLSCTYSVSGYELTFAYENGDKSIYVRKGKLEEFRAKQTAAADAEVSRKYAVTAKPYVEPAKQHKSQIEKLLSQQFVTVSGGTFQMGCTADQDTSCDKDEKPVHSVTVNTFQIGKREVTQKLWELVMESKPSDFKGDDLPVESVSWEEAQIFIATLNGVTGRKYRLPTEAEWEYAARGGNKSKGYKYSGSNNIEDVAWYGGNSGGKTRPVGVKEPKEVGISDMSGNVWEWVRDWYGGYGSGAQINPIGPNTGSTRVIRGGSWHYTAGLCRVSNRDIITPEYKFSNLGFRLAISP
jgi:formylglycine-generating enzyme required for sulfatase activity